MEHIKYFWITLLLLCANHALAYKQPVHMYMSEFAGKNSNLNSTTSNLWATWGLSPTTKFPYQQTKNDFHSPSAASYTYAELLSYGADAEDTGEGLTPPTSRAFSHFFNPQADTKLTIPLYTSNHTSPDWSLEQNKFGSLMNIPGQDFSYNDAQYYFYLAFTSPSASTRNLNMGKMFQSLGHVIHHLQDMAQPEHTRLDMHCDAGPCTELYELTGNDDSSLYEEFTQELLNCGAIVSQAPSSSNIVCSGLRSFNGNYAASKIYLGNYPVPVAGNPRDLWTSENYTGLADFSSGNFITSDTPYKLTPYPASVPESERRLNSSIVDRLLPASDDLRFPDGNSNNTYFTHMTIKDALPNMELGGALTLYQYYRMSFIGLRTVDYNTNRSIDISKMASFSIFTERYLLTGFTSFSVKNIFSVNHFNLQQRAELLLPRAAAYSTALLNYFFRYKIDIKKSGTGDIYNLKNSSNYPLIGKLQFFYDDKNGNRKAIPTAERTINMAVGATITFDPSAFTGLVNQSSNYYAVVVEETGYTQRPVVAVAAAKFEYAKTVNCSTAIETSHVTTREITLGTNSGFVDITASIYVDNNYKRHTLSIKKADGTSFSCKYNFHAGGNTAYIRLNYNPDNFPDYKIRMYMQDYTPFRDGWSSRVACPGEQNSSWAAMEYYNTNSNSPYFRETWTELSDCTLSNLPF